MDIMVRPLFSEGIYSLPAIAVSRPTPPLDLSRGVPKHPGEAEKLMLGNLKLGANPAAGASNIDRTADLACLIDHAAPDELTYFIPTHDGPPRTGRETVAAVADARKAPARLAPVPGWLIAFGALAFSLSVWAFIETALILITDLSLPGV